MIVFLLLFFSIGLVLFCHRRLPDVASVDRLNAEFNEPLALALAREISDHLPRTTGDTTRALDIVLARAEQLVASSALCQTVLTCDVHVDEAGGASECFQ